MAGLSRRLEAAADQRGDAAGVVGTLVLHPETHGLDCVVLAALVSSWAMARAYLSRWGAKRMGEGSFTIGRAELLSTPLPERATQPAFVAEVTSLLGPDGAPRDDDADVALQRVIARAYGVDDAPGFEALAAWYHARSAF